SAATPNRAALACCLTVAIDVGTGDSQRSGRDARTSSERANARGLAWDEGSIPAGSCPASRGVAVSEGARRLDLRAPLPAGVGIEWPAAAAASRRPGPGSDRLPAGEANPRRHVAGGSESRLRLGTAAIPRLLPPTTPAARHGRRRGRGRHRAK